VISAVTIETLNEGREVIGFHEGFKYLIQGDAGQFRVLTIPEVKGIYRYGGSILGTSRANPADSEEHLSNVVEALRRQQVTALVTIGGDDTAYSASQVYARAAGSIKVAHVPKTIDNDLPLPGAAPTFGFETARHVGAGIIRNLMQDAETTARWYLVICMGRAAGHLALGIGKAAAATLTIIPEEFRGRPVRLSELCDIVLGSILKRKSRGSNFGVAVLAEGLLEAIGEEGLLAEMSAAELGRYGNIQRDPHGHLRLGEIEFGRIVKDTLSQRLSEIGTKVTLIDKDLGYELRCADPIPFDAEYTRDLGYGAVKFLRSEAASHYGAIISFESGRMQPLPFEQLIDPQTGRMRPRIVSIDGEGYECARRYMIRLEPADFDEPERLLALATAAGLDTDKFKARFSRLFQHK
jgi:6-phosphofructokinase 1